MPYLSALDVHSRRDAIQIHVYLYLYLLHPKINALLHVQIQVDQLTQPNTRARIKYRECAHEWRRLVAQQEISAEEKIISANNLGAFYNFVNKRISNRNFITVINDPNGTVLYLLALILPVPSTTIFQPQMYLATAIATESHSS